MRRSTQIGSDLGWVRLDRADMTGVPGRVWTSPYPPQILVGYGECRLVRAFGPAMGKPVGLRFCVRSLPGNPSRRFGRYGGIGL